MNYTGLSQKQKAVTPIKTSKSALDYLVPFTMKNKAAKIEAHLY